LAGIPNIIRDGKNGFIVKPRDVGGLRKKILLLLSDEKLFRKMSRNARKTAIKYSWENILSKLEEVYVECVG